MQIIQDISSTKSLCRSLKQEGTLGFVPTMGYLHEGHLSLVKQSVKENPNTIVSIFVNPSQFGQNEDLDTYPRDLERDVALLKECGVEYVFNPNAQTIYPSGFDTWVVPEKLASVLCGKSRPGHFRGVATVVLKLLNITNPDHMYMGIKDYQQLRILKQMASDLHLDCDIVACPIVREADGLAMSSRNSYLNPDERKRALSLYHGLLKARELYEQGERDCGQIIETIKSIIQESGGRIDYIECVDPLTLQSISEAKDDTRMMLAVYFGKTRLIDNMALKA
ncbi:MAG TPA: pantoate--beta-alanine ligase [Candidatus Cloacimonas sp.]|jgi:pantoate--beta-alanine ligase|nr:pantoate--beta-alanine ligase [Candidatus Cloacimonas sp.]